MPCPYRIKINNCYYCGKRIPLGCSPVVCPFGRKVWKSLVLNDYQTEKVWYVNEEKAKLEADPELIFKLCKKDGGYMIKQIKYRFHGHDRIYRLKAGEIKRDTFERAKALTYFFDIEEKEEGKGGKIAIIDSGIKSYQKVNIISLGSSAYDDENHGSIIVDVIKSLVPEADITMIKLPGHEFFDADIISALEEARKRNVHAINLSIQSESPSDGKDPVSIYVNHLAELGIVTCIAAGNGGPASMTVGSPGAAEWALTVGGVNTVGKVMRWSSRGPTLDRRIKPDLSAPAQYVFGDYYLRGTSFAAPFATALSCVVNRDVGHAKITQRLISLSSSPFPEFYYTANKKKALLGLKKHIDIRNIGGYGILNAVRAIEWALLFKSQNNKLDNHEENEK
jgi:hypothetical protein